MGELKFTAMAILLGACLGAAPCRAYTPVDGVVSDNVVDRTPVADSPYHNSLIEMDSSISGLQYAKGLLAKGNCPAAKQTLPAVQNLVSYLETRFPLENHIMPGTDAAVGVDPNLAASIQAQANAGAGAFQATSEMLARAQLKEAAAQTTLESNYKDAYTTASKLTTVLLTQVRFESGCSGSLQQSVQMALRKFTLSYDGVNQALADKAAFLARCQALSNGAAGDGTRMKSIAP